MTDLLTTDLDLEGVRKLLPEDELRQFRKPPLEAYNFPPHFFTSPEIFDLEVKEIFMREWLCVGRVENIPGSGDFITRSIAGESMIVVRDGDGEIRAHLNYCRHRGSQLVEGCGNAKAFRCPYHGWMFGLDGKLRAAPEFRRTVDFKKEDFPLHSLAVEVWNGFVLVNFANDATPFAPRVTDMEKWGLGRYGMDQQVTTHQWEFEIDCNWKAYLENYHEEYHLPWVHGETFQAITPMKGWTFFEDLTEQPWQVGIGQFPGVCIGDTGEPEFPYNKELLTKVPLEYQGMPIWLAFPLFGALNSLDATVWFAFFPDSAEKTRFIMGLMVERDIAERYFAGDPEIVPKVAMYARNSETFIAEDNGITETQHKGLRTRVGGAGRFCEHELGAWMFHEWLIDRVYGPALGYGSLNGHATESKSPSGNGDKG
jgi:nitrite reductase/ring-hydroxylating ferredoxin subunit